MADKLPALGAMATGSPLLPLYPKTFEEVYRFATTAFKAGMLPRQNRREKIDGEWVDVPENDESVLARGVMLLMQGMEVGMPPMACLQLMALINGRITIYGEGVPGVLLARGCKVKRWWSGSTIEGQPENLPPGVEPTDNLTHHTQITRPDGQVFIGTFSVFDAKRARLWDQRETVDRWVGRNEKKSFPNDAPWFKYWQRMLPARSIGFAAKDGAADYMRGIAVREEVEDIERMKSAIDVTPYDAVASAKSAGPAFDATDIPDEPAPVAKAENKPEPKPAAADIDPDPVVDDSPSDAAIIRMIERQLEAGDDRASVMAKHLPRVAKMATEERQQALSLFGLATAG